MDDESGPAPALHAQRRAGVEGDGAAPELRLCQACSRLVPFDGVVVALAATVDDRVPLAGSDDDLRRFGDLQQAVVEGPEVEVLRTGAAVVVDDVRAAGRRWPLLEAVGGLLLPVRSLAVEPLGGSVTGARLGPPLGLLAVARHRVAPFRRHEVAVLARLAGLVTASLVARRPGSGDDASPAGLVADRVALATGLLIGRLHVTPSEALARLRLEAFGSGRTLQDVAAELVEAADTR